MLCKGCAQLCAVVRSYALLCAAVRSRAQLCAGFSMTPETLQKHRRRQNQ